MPTDPRLQGMEIKFNGRTMRARIVLERPSWADNRNEFKAFSMRLQGAARGPRLLMAIVAGQDYGEQGLLIDLTVNTDETEKVLEDRLAEALNKEKLVRGSQAILLLEELEPVSASLFWTELKKMAEAQVATERSRS
jgi:hypothetical protein